MKEKKGVFLFLIVLTTYNIVCREQACSQTVNVQAMSVIAVRSIGDTIFFGVSDFDFMPDGSLIVCDKLDYKIKHLSPTGKLLSETGKRGKSRGEFAAGPLFLTVGKSMIAVADYSSPRVQLFSYTFEFIREFRAKGFVMGLKFDSYDNLWIGTHAGFKKATKLVKYNKEINTQSEIALTHASENMFDNLYYLAITQTDTLVVAYAYQNTIEQYYHDYIRFFRVPGFPIKPKYTAMVKESDIKIPEGEIIKNICLDKNGNLYVLCGDYAFNPCKDVFILNRKGELIAMLQLPIESQKIVVDKQGFLWSLELKGTILTQYKIAAYISK